MCIRDSCKDVRCEICGPVREAIARATEKHKKLEEEKKSKKRKASSSPANGAPPSKRNSIDDDAKFAAELQQLEERWEREDQMMLSTSMGRAYKFVERVASEVYSLERTQGNVGITSVAQDPMVQVKSSFCVFHTNLFVPYIIDGLVLHLMLSLPLTRVSITYLHLIHLDTRLLDG